MAKTVYMVANKDAAGVFTDPDFMWTKDCIGSVVIDCDLSDARREMSDGDALYRCEPIPADEEPVPEPRTVKAYVSFDPSDSDGQDIWAFSTIEAAMDRRGCPIFEIEMREVPPAPKRETGWVVKSHPLGLLFGRDGFCGTSPTFFSEPTAKELAASLAWAHAVEVYRDNLEPVNGGSDA